MEQQLQKLTQAILVRGELLKQLEVQCAAIQASVEEMKPKPVTPPAQASSSTPPAQASSSRLLATGELDALMPTGCSMNCPNDDTDSRTSAFMPDAAPGPPSTAALLDVAITSPEPTDATVLVRDGTSVIANTQQDTVPDDADSGIPTSTSSGAAVNSIDLSDEHAPNLSSYQWDAHKVFDRMLVTDGISYGFSTNIPILTNYYSAKSSTAGITVVDRAACQATLLARFGNSCGATEFWQPWPPPAQVGVMGCGVEPNKRGMSIEEKNMLRVGLESFPEEKMQDQVMSLKQCGVKSEYLGSTQLNSSVSNDAEKGLFDILYMTPKKALGKMMSTKGQAGKRSGSDSSDNTSMTMMFCLICQYNILISSPGLKLTRLCFPFYIPIESFKGEVNWECNRLGDFWMLDTDIWQWSEIALGVLSGRNGSSLTSMHRRQPPKLLIESDSWSLKMHAPLHTRLLEMKQNGRIGIAMKFYEGSIGDKRARLKGGRLPLLDILRNGADMVRGVLDLHSRGILILNLKPCKFLLDEHDRAVLGNFGSPSLLSGLSLPNPDLIQRLGTPNYMAPEHWQPNIRGPISYETDSWGFVCSILEMLSGIQPWRGKSPDEVYQLVVLKKERPLFPYKLPPEVENALSGCFEYDFRDCPLMSDILHAFESAKDTDYDNTGWDSSENLRADNPTQPSRTSWSLFKDKLQVGDKVHSRKLKNSCSPETMEIFDGTIVGMDDEGDWVRLREEDTKRSQVGILHSIDRNGAVYVGLIGMDTLWKGEYSDLQMVEAYCVGQLVGLKANISSPRFEWQRKRDRGLATGRISQILTNGCLVVGFPDRFRLGEMCSCLADLSELEAVSSIPMVSSQRLGDKPH